MSTRVPSSTYRLQVTADFDLFAAADVLPYLADLGADWVYLSPILSAEPGSTHGYDVVDHGSVDASRGGEEGLARLSAEARRLGLGVLVDLVPNHMGVATASANAWWWDLLTHGRESAHAAAFDVDWEAGGGKILVPVVGDDDEGAIEVVDGEVRYHDHRFPLAPGTTTLAEQHYALVGWRRGDAELNYRRFFTVTTLAGVRVEERSVFDASHVEVKRWFDEGLVDGLRIDHPDGLRDPQGYLDDLAGLTGSAYTLVEKILEPGEALDAGWATAGTTGYDALGLIDRVLVDPAGDEPLTALETRLRNEPVDWDAMVLEAKRDVASVSLLAEVRRIAREVSTGSGDSATDVEPALVEVLAAFPVYRSYLPDGRAHLDEALAAAREARPDLAAAFDVLATVLSDPAHPAALRFQQTSGMVMAKGVEDRSFYRYSRLTALNEVGGDPCEFALPVAGFHAAMAERQEHWPTAMTTTTTHDTKRSEDVRARIAVLAEVPEAWAGALDRLLAAAPLPDPGFGNLLWQAVVGTWASDPDEVLRERLHAYAEKAMREAGGRTTWTDQDAAYEGAVHAAVDAAFDDQTVRTTLDEVAALVTDAGWSNSLSAKLLALTIPGVPDVYQGSELWEQSLVDPDNRRPVDYDHRRRALAAHDLTGAGAKLHLVATALRLRRDRPELFAAYTPLEARGSAADHVLAFDRGGVITVATRLPVGLEARGGWGDTGIDLPHGQWRDLVSGVPLGSTVGTTGLADLLGDRPVALLVREDA